MAARHSTYDADNDTRTSLLIDTRPTLLLNI